MLQDGAEREQDLLHISILYELLEALREVAIAFGQQGESKNL